VCARALAYVCPISIKSRLATCVRPHARVHVVKYSARDIRLQAFCCKHIHPHTIGHSEQTPGTMWAGLRTFTGQAPYPWALLCRCLLCKHTRTHIGFNKCKIHSCPDSYRGVGERCGCSGEQPHDIIRIYSTRPERAKPVVVGMSVRMPRNHTKPKLY
jgi:hypothetical protein